eukprot:scaffold144379_cov19-Prasinocladus_malaysianus.AAC.1
MNPVTNTSTLCYTGHRHIVKLTIACGPCLGIGDHPAHDTETIIYDLLYVKLKLRYAPDKLNDALLLLMQAVATFVNCHQPTAMQSGAGLMPT